MIKEIIYYLYHAECSRTGIKGFFYGDKNGAAITGIYPDLGMLLSSVSKEINEKSVIINYINAKK